ncbi:hypothetical protein FC19_GL001218 [Liquorilactobacillus aquaticus DSM 21051]|uniref:WxL domain-containing protein n=1 Tax=Liquorilactobacillus aquaticus DSM 21051 TaxID=1423725 RepID=A0A0R2CWG3_9LACO|nr:WxL domain-containing protein [Liquorilactobacillus aquaticus]KRM96145.1 hypothetical protein FC19_GL001218 [Liquorilactobacillus aquaticus DSM 21051]
MLKKIMAISGITLSALLMLNLGTAKADNSSNSSSSSTSSQAAANSTQATFKVSAGDGTPNNPNGLALTSAPGFTFKDTNVKDISKGTDIGLNKADAPLTIEDYRGSNVAKGWSVSAQLSQFQNKSDPDSSLTGVITFQATSQNTAAASDINGVSIGNNYQAVWNSATNNKGVNTATATTDTTNTKLHFDPSANVSPGTYSATINWTLNDTASN